MLFGKINKKKLGVLIIKYFFINTILSFLLVNPNFETLERHFAFFFLLFDWPPRTKNIFCARQKALGEISRIRRDKQKFRQKCYFPEAFVHNPFLFL
jgi:hypothetical protein